VLLAGGRGLSCPLNNTIIAIAVWILMFSLKTRISKQAYH